MTAPYTQRPQNADALLQTLARARKGSLGAPTPLRAQVKRQKLGGLLTVVVALAAAIGGGAWYALTMLTVSSPAAGVALEAPGAE